MNEARRRAPAPSRRDERPGRGRADHGVAVAVGVEVGVLVGVPAGVLVGVGELLDVAAGLEAVGLDGADGCWLGGASVAVEDGAGVGEGTSGPGLEIGLPAGTVALSAVSVGGAAAAIMIPVTIARMPPMAPAASNRRVQEEAWRIPDAGPSPVIGCLSGARLARAAPLPAPGPGRRPSKNIGAHLRQSPAPGARTWG